ncbi:MAG: hypothetical protein KZQ89_13165 [Candidatus Thiodiazotropha sp. (ex Lucinoma kastoroae)]|nr:hypothetical protein [Candidatus Thiodiazotropha sp. (ex Lucinoma kastoroae)]
MIKYPLFPVFTAMALITLFAIPTIVGIVDQMAANTLFRGILVVITGMAELAIKVYMLTDQLIFSVNTMIKLTLLPVLFGMTLITLLPQFSLVSIIGLMTIKTQRRGMTVFLQLIGMTELTGKGAMNSL